MGRVGCLFAARFCYRVAICDDESELCRFVMSSCGQLTWAYLSFSILKSQEYVGQSGFEQRANAVADGEIVDI